MVCPSCGGENPAGARFCVSCGQALPRICPVCGTVNPPNARFCNQCGTRLTEGTENGNVPSVAPEGGANRLVQTGPAPAAPTATGAALESTEQRRVVTILFADLTSSTTLAEHMDPEDVRSLLGSFFGTMAREIHRHGGTIEKYIGDAVMAVFGLPAAHEDDPLRAVRAALDMQGALDRFNADRRAQDASASLLQIRIGINTGEVAAAGQATEGRDFLITGDPVNVAARLQQAAQPGTILVGPRTYRSTHGAVRYEELAPIPLRGKERPVRIWSALGVSDQAEPIAQRPRGDEAPLVGRSVELALLQASGERAIRERLPMLVTILGVPGIGKTRLANEFVTRLVNAPVWPNASDDARHGGASAAEPVPVSAEAERRTAGQTRRLRGVGSATNATAQKKLLSTSAAEVRRGTRTASGEHARPLVLEGRCPPYGEGLTYWPLAEVLRGYCGVSPLTEAATARAEVHACVGDLLARNRRGEDPELIATYLGHTIGIEPPERRTALLPSDAQKLQEGLLRAWRVFFEALADDRGLVLLLEDIHWADDALLDLLEHIAGRAGKSPILLLTTARPELLERRPGWGGGKRNYVMIALDALSREEAEHLLDALLPGASVPWTLRQGILEKAEGNPFYLEEILSMLRDRGLLVRASDESGWQVAPGAAASPELLDPAIPDTVQGVLLARFDLLPPAERDLLQHAAVFGRVFYPSALRALVSHLNAEELRTLLARLRERDFIRQSSTVRAVLASPDEPVYRFTHALIREVVYSTIVRTRRAHEHARVAEWLEQVAIGREAEVADLLAQHYRQYYIQANLARARDSVRRQAIRDKVLHYLTLAGDQAAARHAALKAVRYYTDAILLVEEDAAESDLPVRVRLYLRRGDARWMVQYADDAWADYEVALKLWETCAPVAPVAAETEGASSGVAAESMRGGTAPGGAKSEGVVLPETWTDTGLRLYWVLVQLPTRYPSYFRHLPGHEHLQEYLERGLALAEHAEHPDPSEYAALLTAKAFFWWSWPERRGEPELLDALRGAREAVRITEDLGEPAGASEALDALANILATTTDLRGFLDNQRKRLRWAAQIDDPGELADIHLEVANGLQMVGDYAEADKHTNVALAVANDADSNALRSQAYSTQVAIFSEWDAWPEAVEAGKALAALSAGIELRHSHGTQASLLELAIVHQRQGAHDTAERLERRVNEAYPQSDTMNLQLLRGRLALAQGATKEARQVWLAALECRSGRHSLASLQSELAELAARTGETNLYERFGAHALELGWRSGAKKALAQAIRARGITAIRVGAWEDALTDVQNALSRYSTLGTEWEQARTRYVLAGLYQRRSEPGDAEAMRAELTQALALFERLRAVRDVARARAALAGGNIRLP